MQLQPAESLLIGFLGALLLVAVGAFVFLLFRIDSRLKDLHAFTGKVEIKLGQVTVALGQLNLISAGVTAVLKATAAMSQTTEAIRGLSALLVSPSRQEGGEEAPTWGRIPGPPPPIPPNPIFDAYAAPGESAILEQDEEELAELERQELLRQQGIETSPDRIPVPEPSLINLIQGQ